MIYERADRSFDRTKILQKGLAAIQEFDAQVERRATLLRKMIELNEPAERIAWVSGELASYELHIDPPTILTMSGDEIQRDPGKLGWASPSSHQISIRMSECSCRIAEVVAHECQHRKQMIEGRFTQLLGKGQSEPDAKKYEQEFKRRFLGDVRCSCRTRLSVDYSHLLNR
jgi:hypothetical protein